MKNLLFFITILILSLGFYSCTEDNLDSSFESQESITKSKEETEVPTVNVRGVRSNGRWLTFNSQRTFKATYQQLTKAMLKYDEPKEDETIDESGESKFEDINPVLEAWEIRMGHRSLRRSLLQTEYNLLERGEHPQKVLNELQDYGILDDIYLSFLSEDGVVQVGKDIIIMDDGHAVSTTDPSIAIKILDDGDVVIYGPDVIDDVDITHFGGGMLTAPDCTAAFTLSGQTDTGEGVAATFTWAENANVGDLASLELTWNFGDGSGDQTSENGFIGHTYAEGGTYTVCLGVEWVYVDENGENPEDCEIFDCMDVTIVEDPDPEDCSEELCTALQVISFSGFEVVAELLIDETSSIPGRMCMSTTGLLDIAAQYCSEVEASDITFYLNQTEQTFTGSGCFDVPCDAEYDIEVTIGDCSTTLTVDYNRFAETQSCDDDDSDTGWGWEEFVDDEKGISYRLQTKSKENNFLFFGSNEIWAKMYNYEYRKGGLFGWGSKKWRKTKKDLRICFHGTIYGDQNCACDDNTGVGGCKDDDNTKSMTHDEPYFSDYDGISAHEDDPWYAKFYVQGQMVKNASCFE